MPWLVEHAADMLNKYVVGKDGRTPYERIHGKRCKGEMFEFGRKVSHMFPGKHGGGSMKERWGTGIFLGKRGKSDECLVSTEDCTVVKCISVKLLPENASWEWELVEKILSPR